LEEKDKMITQLENTIASMQNDVSASHELKKKVVDNDTILNERNRIQQALNDNMQQNANLQKKLNQKELDISKINEEVSSLKEYISKLEEIVPVTKLKKIVGTTVAKVESTIIDANLNNKEKVQSGGVF
jgi:predicted nuclease with TOPRIM domain